MRKSVATMAVLLIVFLMLPAIGLCEFAENRDFGIAVELPKGWQAAKKSPEGYFFASGRNAQNTMVVCKRPEKPRAWSKEGLMEERGQASGFEFISYHASEDGAEKPWMSFKNTSQSADGGKLRSFFYYYTLADGATASCAISLVDQPDAAMLSWIAAVEENLLGRELTEE